MTLPVIPSPSLRALALALLLVALLAACGGGDDDNPPSVIGAMGLQRNAAMPAASAPQAAP